MQIILHLKPEAAKLVRSGKNALYSSAIYQTLRSFGIVVKPLHPEGTSPEFYADIETDVSPEVVLDLFRHHSFVVSAYIKP